MSMKSIVVVASGEESDNALLVAACELAKRREGHVRVIPAFPDPAARLVYYGASLHASSDAAQRVADAERGMQERVQERARVVAKELGLGADPRGGAPSIRVDQRALAPAVALAPAAVLSDLVMFGAADVQSPLMSGLFAETLLSTRAATFLFKGPKIQSGPVAIAWDGSAQAGRAAKVGLSLMQAASGVLVLRNVDDETTESEAGSLDDLITYLRQHGVTNIATRELHGERVAPSLLAAAKADKCEVLIAGGYGRPRLFELVLGGTTRTLVQSAEPINLLLAH